jgi:manganese transport protein
MKLLARLRKIGPGMLVTAAFIGPGTVTTASAAGLKFDLTLLWAVAFSTVATIILQEMSARLGIVSRKGLGESIREGVTQPGLRELSIALVLMAILFGNSAYQTGNLTGAAQGMVLITGLPAVVWIVIIGLAAAVLLWTSTYNMVSNILVALVIAMSVVFIATAVMVKPDLHEVATGLLQFRVPANSLSVIIGLIGTTVVPYNLFLHASAAQKQWDESVPTREALLESRIDTVLSILLGGLVTGAIVVTGAALSAPADTQLTTVQMAEQLKPLVGGSVGPILFSLGLFAAGMTSAITAPLAAAYATAGILGWQAELKSTRFRCVWGGVILVGVVLAAAFGKSPAETILVAQVANGILLPVIAAYLLFAVNRRSVMKDQANGVFSNIFGFGCVAVAAFLGIWLVLTKTGIIK